MRSAIQIFLAVFLAVFLVLSLVQATRHPEQVGDWIAAVHRAYLAAMVK